MLFIHPQHQTNLFHTNQTFYNVYENIFLLFNINSRKNTFEHEESLFSIAIHLAMNNTRVCESRARWPEIGTNQSSENT